MNYIGLIKKFWFLQSYHSLTVTEIALYFYLLEINNVCSWSSTFSRNNKKVEADLNISFNTLANARNKLRQVGLIDFETKNGSPNVIYTLSKFDKVIDKVTGEVGYKVQGELLGELAGEIIKQRQKQEEKEIIREVSVLFFPPSVDEIREYCLERKNTISPQRFFDFYQSKDWMVGKNKMKDWKACVRTWEINERKIQDKKHPAANYKSLKNETDERF